MTGSAYPSAPQTAGKATAALVCGIIGLVICGPVGIAAIVLARQAENEIAASGGSLGGDGLAKAGRIMGWIAVALMILGVIIVVIALAAGSDNNNGY